MANLTEEQKEFIVVRLAMFDPPRVISAALQDEFGIDVDRRQIDSYNGDNSHGSRKLAKQWRAVFDKTRAAFLAEASRHPIAERGFRLRSLGTMHAHAIDKGNLVLAASLLEQAAREVGDSFTNSRKLTGSVTVTPDEPSLEERRNSVMDEIAAAMGKARAQSTVTKH